MRTEPDSLWQAAVETCSSMMSQRRHRDRKKSSVACVST
jgi:hypothetical protein